MITRIYIAILFTAILISPVMGDTGVMLRPMQIDVSTIELHLPTTPQTNAQGMDKPGPVNSPDPYYTLQIGETSIYRDALNPALAYYKPTFKIGKREGTSLATFSPETLAGQVDGFLFQYYGFESGGIKWANMMVVIRQEKPEDVTLEAVQKSWTDITELRPLTLSNMKVKMLVPFPPMEVNFSEMPSSGVDGDNKWYVFSTTSIANLTPADLSGDPNNDTLDETEAPEFATAIKSDMSSYPSFQPKLEVRVEYAGWGGTLPFMKFSTPIQFERKDAAELRIPMGTIPFYPISYTPDRQGDAGIVLASIGPSVVPYKGDMIKVMQPSDMPLMMPPKIIGTLQARDDIDYAYTEASVISAPLPIGYPKNKTENYDYYFFSNDTSKIGGPWFQETSSPESPTPSVPPATLTGWWWYESHFLGRRLVWASPRNMSLKWDTKSGMRPSCRYTLVEASDGKLKANIIYDLYPEFATRQFMSAIDTIKTSTGEDVDLFPFTDLLDANKIKLVSASPMIKQMVDDKKLVPSIPPATSPNDPWLRLTAEIEIGDDWSGFTQFMKLGDMGNWKVGVRDTADEINFKLNGDLIKAMGGPAVASLKSYNDATGGYEISLDNYGIIGMQVKGLRFLLTGGAGNVTRDIWFDGDGINLPGMGSTSSYDQAEGSGGRVAGTYSAPDWADLKTLWDSGAYYEMAVGLVPDMVAPSTGPETTDPSYEDILFSYIRSLCYQYVGGSQMIEVPVVPAETSQWSGYSSGRIFLRYQGFVYTQELDLQAPDANKVKMRMLPAEGAYAWVGTPSENDKVEYRAVFVKGGDVTYLPLYQEAQTNWLSNADTTGVIIDMTASGTGPSASGGDTPAPPVEEPAESSATGDCTADANNDSITAVLIHLNETVSGWVCPDDLFDYYYFTIPDGFDVSGNITFVSGQTGTTVRVQGDAATIFANLGTLDTSHTIEIPITSGTVPPGRYYIRVGYYSAYAWEHDYSITMALTLVEE